MRKKTKNIIVKMFAVTSIVLMLFGFTVTTTALALIPNWTQESRLSCFPSDTPTEQIPAFIYGMRKKLERIK